MDIEKMIEQLNNFNENHITVLCGSGQCACGYLCDKDDCIVVRAATALSTLQDENEKLRTRNIKLEDTVRSQRNGLTELRADLARVTAERDAAIKDIWTAKWVSCKHGEGCDFISARTGVPDCAGCGDWEWRGIKKED